MACYAAAMTNRADRPRDLFTAPERDLIRGELGMRFGQLPSVAEGVFLRMDELVSRKRHDLGLAILPVVFPGEADLAVVEPDQATVGEGDAVGVAAEIAEHLLGPGEWRLGVDDPVDLGRRVEPSGKGGGVGQAGERAGKAQFVTGEGGA